MGVCRGLSCQICGKSETITLDDISVGDVFLAGGQSNMEFQMRYDADMAAEREVCENPTNDRGNPFEDPFGETMLFGTSREE